MVKNTQAPSIVLQTQLVGKFSNRQIDTSALCNSGAEAVLINSNFAHLHRLSLHRLPRPIAVTNVDGSDNVSGSIKWSTRQTLRTVSSDGLSSHTEEVEFLVADIGNMDIILGTDWLRTHNPEIDWSSGKVTMSRCPDDCRIKHILTQRKHRERQKLKKKGDRAKGGRPQPVTMEELDDDDDVGG